FMQAHHVPPPDLVPMVRARLTQINGVDTASLKIADERGRDFLDREANLTWARQLQSDNRIVAGRWWSDADISQPQVSVEMQLARSLGLRLGDELTYDVAGETITARVTSLREVKWDSFRPNFFMVFSPGVLDQATG